MTEKPRSYRVTCYMMIVARLQEKAYDLGYALCVHGSLNRDCDLVACPWREDAVSARKLIDEFIVVSGGFLSPHEEKEFPRTKPHGRLAWSIHLGGGPYLDVSVMPRAPAA